MPTIKGKYKHLSAGGSRFIEINYTILTLKTVPINTSAVEAECYRWKRIPQQNTEIKFQHLKMCFSLWL